MVVANNGLQHEPDGHGVSSVTKLGDGGRRVGVVEWKLMGDPSSVFSTSLRVLHYILIRPSHEIAKVGVADALRCVALLLGEMGRRGGGRSGGVEARRRAAEESEKTHKTPLSE